MRELVQPGATPEVLAFAAQTAVRTGDRQLDVRARLLLIVALVDRGARRDAEALVDRAVDDALEWPELGLERAMARAAVRRSGALQELAVALRGRPDARGFGLLGEGLSRLGAWEKADTAYLEALRSGSTAQAPELSLRRAANLIIHGRSQEALDAIRPALQGTQLVHLSALLLLGGLLVETGRGEEALEVAMAAGEIAEGRRNWYALSVAAMDAAAAWTLQGDHARGISILHATLTTIRQQGDPGVLLMARLVEIQQEQRQQAATT